MTGVVNPNMHEAVCHSGWPPPLTTVQTVRYEKKWSEEEERFTWGPWGH